MATLNHTDMLDQLDPRYPTRVWTGKGTAVSCAEAKHDWDIVLVRDDGWTLGCRYEDFSEAADLWQGDWVAYVDLDSRRVYDLTRCTVCR